MKKYKKKKRIEMFSAPLLLHTYFRTQYLLFDVKKKNKVVTIHRYLDPLKLLYGTHCAMYLY
jgi:hypothetical protein